MTASPRKSQRRIAHSSVFAAQPAFGTPLANAAIDTVFSLSDEDVQFEILTKDDVIKDCSGQYDIDEVVLAKSCRLAFGVYVEPDKLFGLLGWFMGVVAGNTVTMLGPDSFQPPATTFIYGYLGSAVSPLKLQDMTGGLITVTGRVNERLRASLEFRGHGSPAAAAGYVFPDCETVTPLYLKDGALSINAVNRLADCREFELRYGNNLLFEEDPFTMASENITRMERADEREYGLSVKLWGEPGDALHTQALAKAKMPFSLRIGAAADGVTVDAVSAILKQNGAPTHDGEANRSVLNLLLKPIRIPGNANTPLKATRNIA